MTTKRMVALLLCAVVATAVFLACGGKANPGGTVCAKEAECAKAEVDEFSVSKCEEEALYDFEDADSIGCGDQWKAIYDCAATLDCTAWKDNSKFDDKCGDLVKALQKCVDTAKHNTTDGGTPPSSDVG